LQAHINAVEFFGVNMRNLKHLELDMLDELFQKIQGRVLQQVQPRINLVYQGREIELNVERLREWITYCEDLL